MSKSITFVVGRFQPLHNAHLHLIKEAIDIADGGYTVVFIGNNNCIDERNPFTYEQRASMVMKSLSEYTGLYCVKPLPDVPGDDMKWLSNIIDTLNSVVSNLKLYNSKYKVVVCDKDESTKQSNDLFDKIPNCSIIRLDDVFRLNATDIRKKLFVDNTPVDMIDEIPNGTKQVLNKYIAQKKSKYKVK